MNEKQRQELIDFAPNFVKLLRENGFTRNQAADALHSAIVCLFVVIWKVPIDENLSEEEKDFCLHVQIGCLNMIYRQEVVA